MGNFDDKVTVMSRNFVAKDLNPSGVPTGYPITMDVTMAIRFESLRLS
jgi:hypothetical protein